MPISQRFLNRACNRHVSVAAWHTLGDWLAIMASNRLTTPLIDFGKGKPRRVGVTELNWYLMDLLGLRYDWFAYGQHSRDEVWLLINPMRYRLLGHQPRRPYACDVHDFLRVHAKHLLQETLQQHAYFALAPTVYAHTMRSHDAYDAALQAPWGRIGVLNKHDEIVGMVWAPAPAAHGLPPILKPLSSVGSSIKADN